MQHSAADVPANQGAAKGAARIDDEDVAGARLLHSRLDDLKRAIRYGYRHRTAHNTFGRPGDRIDAAVHRSGTLHRVGKIRAAEPRHPLYERLCGAFAMNVYAKPTRHIDAPLDWCGCERSFRVVACRFSAATEEVSASGGMRGAWAIGGGPKSARRLRLAFRPSFRWGRS